SLAGADGFLVLEDHLKQDVGMGTPRMTPTEFADALRDVEEAGHVTSVRSARGLKFKINDLGRAWLSENRD
ncbi:MAG: hypothetical protein ACQKBU_10050, partial [Verrucomicrobiales bacterium]